MHRFRSISYSGIPVDGWDYVHSPLIKPERVHKDEEAKEEEERKNRFQNVVSVASKVKRFVKAVRRKTKKSKRLHWAFWYVVLYHSYHHTRVSLIHITQDCCDHILRMRGDYTLRVDSEGR